MNQNTSADIHNIKILSTANTMIFPGSCKIMIFTKNFSLLIATLQETPLSKTFFTVLFAGVFAEKEKIYPYTYCPPLLSVPTMPVLDFLLLSFSFTILYPLSLKKMHPRHKHTQRT